MSTCIASMDFLSIATSSGVFLALFFISVRAFFSKRTAIVFMELFSAAMCIRVWPSYIALTSVTFFSCSIIRCGVSFFMAFKSSFGTWGATFCSGWGGLIADFPAGMAVVRVHS